MPISSSTSSRVSLRAARLRALPAARRCSSRDSAEKLLMKLSGFLISWAMPAVSWPSEASFSDWISRSCALRRSSSEAASSRVRACTSSNSRTFSMAITAWSAKVCTISIWRSVNGPARGAPATKTPSTSPSRSSGTPSNARVAELSAHRAKSYSGSSRRRRYARLAGQQHARRRGIAAGPLRGGRANCCTRSLGLADRRLRVERRRPRAMR